MAHDLFDAVFADHNGQRAARETVGVNQSLYTSYGYENPYSGDAITRAKKEKN